MHGWIGKRLGRPMATASLLGSLLIAGGHVANVGAASCLATGALDRDGTALTARIVNPAGTVSGTVNATGCDVGVYVGTGHGRVAGAQIYGARYYGVLVDGNAGHTVHVDVIGAAIHDIGDSPITSSRHGQGVAFRAFGGGSASGTVAGSRVWSFQEAGLNATGPGAAVTMTGNVVRGRGPIATIAQNGIQVIFGAHGVVTDNWISDLGYLGLFTTGTGVLVTGGPIYDGNPTNGCLPSGCDYTTGARVTSNVITDVDAGVVAFSGDELGNPSPDPTGNLVRGNLIVKRTLTNTDGWDVGVGYQAGVFDYGNADRIVDNVILGHGYDQAFCGAAAVCLALDVADAIDPFVSGNVVR